MLVVREDEPDRFTVVHQADSVRDANGVHQRWDIINSWSAEELAKVGLFRVQQSQPPRGRTVTGFTVQRVGNTVEQVLELGDVADDLINYSALRRWEAETQGLWTSLGFGVLTDRESQGMINGAFSFIMNNPDRTVHWKRSATDFIELNRDQVQQLATDVAEHVQRCFSTEYAVIGKILAGEITTAEQVDDEFTEAGHR